MTESTFQQPIAAFLGKAASSSPTPGGGAVAALAGALGASMGSMASNLSSKGKEQDDAVDWRAAVELFQQAGREMEPLAEADMQAFAAYLDALRMPKESEQEKSLRRKRLDEAILAATSVPLELMRVCAGALEMAERLVHATSMRVLSDLGICILLLAASAESAGLTVRLNIGSVRDAAAKAKLEEDLRGLLRVTEERKAGAMLVIDRRIRLGV